MNNSLSNRYMAPKPPCIVKGSDDETFDLPESQIVEIAGFRVGVIGGHQILPWGDELALQQWQRKLDVDILISGHEHYARTVSKNGKLYMSPGSVTGVVNHCLPINAEEPVTASFLLLQAVEHDRVVIYVYKERGGEFVVEQFEHQKQG